MADDTIADLLIMIDKGELRLPHFQRAFVWTRKQVLSYLDSLYSNYPAGSILIWKRTDTENMIPTRGGRQ